MLDVNLNWAPHPAQKKILDHPARFKVNKAGRRFGKTELDAYFLIKNAGKPNSNHWLVAPTYRQAKEMVWDKLLRMIPRELIKGRNQVELSVRLVNGSRISLKGAERKDQLRGPGLDSLVVEEAAFIDHDVWPKILRAMLAESQGPVIFSSTPDGKNWFEELYQYAAGKMDAEWAGFHHTIYDNPYITREEIAAIKASPEMSDLTWRQEYLAEVMAMTGQVYSEFSDSRNVVLVTDESRDWVCVPGIDYGLDDYTACMWLHICPKTGVVLVRDEYRQYNVSIGRNAESIKQGSARRELHRGYYILDRSNFRRDPTSMVSVAHEFKKYGMACVPSERDPIVGRDLLKRSLEGGWLQISSACPVLISALQSFKFGQHEPDVISAVRYALMYIYQQRLSNIFTSGLGVEPVHDRSANTYHDPSGKYNIDSRTGRICLLRPGAIIPAPEWNWSGEGY